MNPLSPPAELVALARCAAETHALWPELVCAIVEQESSWNPWALRYEPEFYEKYVAPQIARGAIDDVTESRARAFSWGLMQVMGQAARERYEQHFSRSIAAAAFEDVLRSTTRESAA